MPARGRKDRPAQRWPRENPDQDEDEAEGQDQDAEDEDEAGPSPDEPGEPQPAVPPPGGPGQPYTPVLPPLGEAMSECRQADGELAAEQIARPNPAVAGVRAHLAKVMAALEKLGKPADG